MAHDFLSRCAVFDPWLPPAATVSRRHSRGADRSPPRHRRDQHATDRTELAPQRCRCRRAGRPRRGHDTDQPRRARRPPPPTRRRLPPPRPGRRRGAAGPRRRAGPARYLGRDHPAHQRAARRTADCYRPRRPGGSCDGHATEPSATPPAGPQPATPAPNCSSPPGSWAGSINEASRWPTAANATSTVGSPTDPPATRSGTSWAGPANTTTAPP
jgi:hypothetical protein